MEFAHRQKNSQRPSPQVIPWGEKKRVHFSGAQSRGLLSPFRQIHSRGFRIPGIIRPLKGSSAEHNVIFSNSETGRSARRKEIFGSFSLQFSFVLLYSRAFRPGPGKIGNLHVQMDFNDLSSFKKPFPEAAADTLRVQLNGAGCCGSICFQRPQREGSAVGHPRRRLGRLTGKAPSAREGSRVPSASYLERRLTPVKWNCFIR